MQKPITIEIDGDRPHDEQVSQVFDQIVEAGIPQSVAAQMAEDYVVRTKSYIAAQRTTERLSEQADEAEALLRSLRIMIDTTQRMFKTFRIGVFAVLMLSIANAALALWKLFS